MGDCFILSEPAQFNRLARSFTQGWAAQTAKVPSRVILHSRLEHRWQPSQKNKKLNDGSLELTLRAPERDKDLDHGLRLPARVLEPATLVKEIKDDLGKALNFTRACARRFWVQRGNGIAEMKKGDSQITSTYCDVTLFKIEAHVKPTEEIES
jgi:hypothetical protein